MKFKLISVLGMVLAVALSGCGGGDSSTTATPPATIIGGVAAVGSPILNGVIKVTCAAGSAIPNTATNSSTGAWQVTLSGQTLPCAVQVSGGTINGVSNATPYHSIAITTGTVNVTPLTDLMVANLAGTATPPGAWFTGLSPATLNIINQTVVDGVLAKLRLALALTPLNTINPITLTFNATIGNSMDDILAALKTAMTSAGVTYAALLTNAAQASFITPVGFNAALTAAYAGTTSGGGIAIPAVPVGVTATTSSSTQINVNWTNVSGATAYNIYRSTSANVQITAANKITATTPPTAVGPYSNTGLAAATTYYYKVTAVNAAGETIGSTEVSATTSATGAITPTITSFTPGTGAAGASVTIAGTNFSVTVANNTVNFNGVAATVTSATATQLIVTVPAATSGTITVTVSGQTATSATAFTIAGGGTGGGGVVGTQMGGARQGVALNIAAGAGVVTTFAGSGAIGAFNDGTGTAATFVGLWGVTTDGTNLYVADSGIQTIRQIVIATGVVTTLAGSPTIIGSADGTGSTASFGAIFGITTDGTNLYVVDSTYHKIRKIVIATGVVTTLAGTGTAGAVDGTGTAASFNNPRGITTDGTNLYVSDLGNQKIRKIVIATGVVTTLAGVGGTPGATEVNGPGATATFFNPQGITTDGTNVYVVEGSYRLVRKIVISTGVVSTLAGSGFFGGGATGFADGTGTAASFNQPFGVTTDGTNLYVGDTQNNRIRKVVIATGVVTTLAGSATQGTADGTGSAASFHFPAGITTDGTSLYVVDSSNRTIRKIQ